MNWVRDRWIFGSIALAYAAGLLLLLPWASEPGYSAPSLIGIYGVTILAADLCTVILLVRLYLREGTPHLLVFAGAYAFSALMVTGHALSFPGAFTAPQVFGHSTTSVIMFLSWRIGGATLLLAGILLGVQELSPAPPARRARNCVLVLAASIALGACCFAAALALHMAPMEGGRFDSATSAASWLAAALCAASVIFVFGTSSQRPILAWVALVSTACFTDLVLSTVGGGRYTLGWYVARSSSVVSAYMLLAYLSIEFARELRARREPARRFVYFAAVALAVCAVLLRYFLVPWLGDTIPFATLFGAVAVAVWMGGWGPGTLTAVLAFALAHLFIQEPFAAFSMSTAREQLALVLYGISCALIISLGHHMRTARERSRRAEERFRSSQEAAIQGYIMLRAVVDSARQVTDFEFEYINPRGAEFARRPLAELMGRRLGQVLPGARNTGLLQRLRAVYETGVPVEFEQRYDHDGISGWFRNMVVKVADGVAISFFDISQNKALERELAERAQQLERADLNKGNFLATLSHELRNPLAPLRNGLAVLRHRVGKEDANLLKMMDRQLNHLVRLVDDLLDVSRIDRGKIDLRHECAEVEQFIHSAVETARPSIDAKRHELLIRTAPRPLHVEGDPVRLAQIVSNLLINAAKFTPAHGRIELEVADRGAEVEIGVADNGMGIESDQLKSVFEMFVQLESNRAQSSGGLGLGLALVKSLAELHHGSVEASSQGPGRGAEFRVRLPLIAQERVRPADRPMAGRLPEAGNRVLVVDDNQDAASSLAELLRTQGHEVDTFFDAQQALASATSRLPQVAFLDLNMPGMDGLALARQLRRLRGGDRMCLVAVTGMGRESDVAQALDAGFDAHLTKPADLDRLLALAKARSAPCGVEATPGASHSDDNLGNTNANSAPSAKLPSATQ